MCRNEPMPTSISPATSIEESSASEGAAIGASEAFQPGRDAEVESFSGYSSSDMDVDINVTPSRTSSTESDVEFIGVVMRNFANAGTSNESSDGSARRHSLVGSQRLRPTTAATAGASLGIGGHDPSARTAPGHVTSENESESSTIRAPVSKKRPRSNTPARSGALEDGSTANAGKRARSTGTESGDSSDEGQQPH